MKKLFMSLVAVFMLNMPVYASVEGVDNPYFTDYAVDVFLNDEKMDLIPPAVALNNVTMVPFRQLFKAYGADVNWDSETNSIRATKDDIQIILTIDSLTAYVNGKEVRLTQTPNIAQYTDGNMYAFVNLRFISENLGGTVVFTKNPIPTVNIRY